MPVLDMLTLSFCNGACAPAGPGWKNAGRIEMAIRTALNIVISRRESALFMCLTFIGSLSSDGHGREGSEFRTVMSTKTRCAAGARSRFLNNPRPPDDKPLDARCRSFLSSNQRRKSVTSIDHDRGAR